MIPDGSPIQHDILRVGAIEEVPLILDVCRKMTGMGFIAVARVTEDHWVTCASLDDLDFGLGPGDELEVESTICHEVRTARDVIVIEDVDANASYRDHPTPRRYGFKSYISVPIVRADGSFFGTLCAIDPRPRPLSAETVAMFHLFTRIIANGLDAQDEITAGREALASERDTARLREEFIAVVGHDLRNPVAAVTAGLRMISRQPAAERVAMLIPEMQRSMMRMQQIIDNLLDFARGRLGAGIELHVPKPVPLGPVIQGVVREIEQVSERVIDLAVDPPRPILCDPLRMGQLLSNLLGNAVTHGEAVGSIRVEATDQGGVLRLAVTNQGPAIPEDVLPSLFMPFSRGSETASLQGLGLGLYIASEIARAHGGRIDVESTDAATTFVLTMPTGDVAQA